jgi:fructan beta-fructosidase
VTDFTITSPYLLIPIKNGAEKHTVELLHNGNRLRYFSAELCNSDDADWIATYSVKAIVGKSCAIRIDATLEESNLTAGWTQSESMWTPGDMYKEPQRPRYHFSPRTGWQNDPNGLVFHDGTFHLFYQHNPFGRSWGNMHWGHAVSGDLMRWKELGDAIFPDGLGTIFSGGAIVDSDNVSGLGDGSNPPILCFYTAAGSHALEPAEFTQCVAYSADGVEFKKYKGNPIIGHIADNNRDPKVVWVEELGRFVLTIYVTKKDDRHVYRLFTSKNLLDWKPLQELNFGDTSECPELFRLEKTDGEYRWIFWGADGGYYIGSFGDGGYNIESGPHASYASYKGGSAYAAQVFSNLPDDRTIMLAWQTGDIDAVRFNCNMTAPVELGLAEFDDGLRLTASPAREIDALAQNAIIESNMNLTNEPRVIDVTGVALDLRIHTSSERLKNLELEIRGASIDIDAVDGHLRFDDRAYGVSDLSSIRVLLDAASIEIFADRGRCWIARRVFPDSRLPVVVRGQGVCDRIEVRKIISVWD